MTTFPTSHTALDASLDDRAALSCYANTGDPSAFAALTQRYQHMVLATCRRVLRSQADAEDAAQETFLKFAKHAGVIRGNAAAWLHACAFGTATDMLRRQGSRVRAERKASLDTAGEAADATANTDDARTWKELEPLLDEALAQLSPEEREAIVGHYLVGRPQKDLAREAGVSPGTMSRRIDTALTALQARIQSRGIRVSGAAALAGALVAGIATTDATAGLSASLAKVALAEAVLTGKRLAVASWLSGKTLGIAACLVGAVAVSITSLVALQSPSPGSSPIVPALVATADAFNSIPRPEKPSERMSLVSSTVDGVLEEVGRIKFAPERIDFSESHDALRPAKLVFKRLETKKQGEVTKIRVLIESAENVNKGKLGDLTNQSGTLSVRPKGARLGVDLELEGLEGNMGEINVVREPGKEPDAPGPEPFAGEWLQLRQWNLSLEPDTIVVWGNGEFAMQKYKILSWSEEAGLSKVETICAANVNDTAAIGKRFKMLLRRQGKEVSFAIHTVAAKQTDAWPSFEVKKGSAVRLAKFTED